MSSMYFVESSALFSECRRYRYMLWRGWDRSKPYAMFIGLNPSTADERQLDPTCAKCCKWAHAWGYGGYLMTNAFAYRTTHPKIMMGQKDPIGPDNDRWIEESARDAGIVIACWGNGGAYMGRADDIVRMIPHLYCMKVTKKRQPWHPLYLPNASKPMYYSVGKSSI